jgi:hypothetical protein
VLSSLLRPANRGDEHGAIRRLEVAVVGHVDRQPLAAASDSHLCTALQEALAYTPPVPWTAVPEDAEESERLYANNQLAWCRAASVTDALVSGMRRAARRTGSAAPADSMELAVAGFGDTWLATRKDGRCPGTGKPIDDDPRCADARRVDLLLRFVPSEESTVSRCEREGDSTADALACLERCIEQAAVGAQVGSGVAARSAPLFIDGEDRSDLLPVGFYLHRVPAFESRALDLRRVCRTLGVPEARCGGE